MSTANGAGSVRQASAARRDNGPGVGKAARRALPENCDGRAKPDQLPPLHRPSFTSYQQVRSGPPRPAPARGLASNRFRSCGVWRGSFRRLVGRDPEVMRDVRLRTTTGRTDPRLGGAPSGPESTTSAGRRLAPGPDRKLGRAVSRNVMDRCRVEVVDDGVAVGPPRRHTPRLRARRPALAAGVRSPAGSRTCRPRSAREGCTAARSCRAAGSR